MLVQHCTGAVQTDSAVQVMNSEVQVLELTPRSLVEENSHVVDDEELVQVAREVFGMFDKVVSKLM